MYTLPDHNGIAPESDEESWEIFHENSKTSQFNSLPPNEEIRRRMEEMWTAIPFAGYKSIGLPDPMPLRMPFDSVITARTTARSLEPCTLDLIQLSTLLAYSYGETRSNEDSGFPRPFRVIPSGGALYPLEVYFHTNSVHELEGGLYHYDPSNNAISLLLKKDLTRELARGLVQPELVLDSAVQFFVTAIFERSTFKYGERGYRFVLLEAGHLVQNLNLVATAQDLGVVNIGGFFDRQLDQLLEIDGFHQSTVYAMAVGGKGSAENDTVW